MNLADSWFSLTARSYLSPDLSGGLQSPSVALALEARPFPSGTMDLTDELEPLIGEMPSRVDGRGRPWRSSREVLNGILWILRTGAQWANLPERYPPYQTCHRRHQRWVHEGLLERILEALARDLKERGELDLSECFIDGTFVAAKKGEDVWERPSGAK